MPYEMRQQDSKWCVFNKATGDNKGCSPSRDMAVKHMRALYAVEGGATLKKKDMGDQPCCCDACIAMDVGDALEEGGMPAPMNGAKAVWTSAYINDLPDSAFAYIEPDCKAGNCRHFPIKGSDGKYDAAHVRNALARASQSPFGSKAMPKLEAAARALKIGDHSGKSLDDLIASVTDTVKSWFQLDSEPRSIVATKQADGRVRVFMRVSNMYKDRHGEIITSSAHKEYEQHVEQSGEYPEFWLWHTPGSKWGQADLVSFDDGFLTVSGLADPGMEHIALALGEQKDLGVSHGFKGISLEGRGYIDWYRMKEASPLPRAEAANLWTSLAVEKGMALQDKHKKFFESIGVPTETIQTWDKENKDIDGLLKAAGIEYKEVESPPAPEPEPKPDEKVTATLADGSIVELPTSVVNEHKQAASSELGQVLAELKTLGTRLKALEDRDPVSDQLEQALRNGKGFEASKQGSAPTETEAKANKDWEEELANLLLPAVGGGAN